MLSLLAVTFAAGCSIDIEGIDAAIDGYNTAARELASITYPAADADPEGLATSLERAAASFDEMAAATVEQCPAIAEGVTEVSATLAEVAQMLRADSQTAAVPDVERLLRITAEQTVTWAAGCGLNLSDGQLSRPSVSQ